MRAIAKGPEPVSLIAHRQKLHCDYDNYQDKDALRRALATEQRGLCCYCMGRIRPDANVMKIEHWKCQVRYPDEQLSYRNLLGACLGGQGQPVRLQYCDTRKGDADLLWNPADPAHAIETRVQYGLDGTIASDDGTFDIQLNKVLNLNLAILKNNRKGILDAVLEWWEQEKRKLGSPVPRRRMERKRDRYIAGDGQLTPYCQVAIWWLSQKLACMP